MLTVAFHHKLIRSTRPLGRFKTQYRYVNLLRVVITGRGGYKMEILRVRNFLRPPPPKTGLTFSRPQTPFRIEWKLFAPPPFNMAKTSSYRVKTKVPKTVCAPPPFSMAKTFSAPSFRRGKTSHAPTLPFC